MFEQLLVNAQAFQEYAETYQFFMSTLCIFLMFVAIKLLHKISDDIEQNERSMVLLNRRVKELESKLESKLELST